MGHVSAPVYLIVMFSPFGSPAHFFSPSVEQNVVIVAACVPTLRPLFRKAFTSKSTNRTGSNSRSRSGPAFKMRNSRLHHVSRRLPTTESELALGETYDKTYDVEANPSLAIWKTQEFAGDLKDGRVSRPGSPRLAP